MPTSLRKQLVDRRRVVHGIAIGREQIEHGGHPLDDTGAIVSIHMTLLLIAENNLYGRDGDEQRPVRRERDEGQPKRGRYNGIG